MRRTLLALFVLLLTVPLSAQLLGPPQNITVVDSGTACVTAPAACAIFDVNTSNSVAFDISGTWTGTLTFEGTTNGGAYRAILVTNTTTGAKSTTTTASGTFAVPNGGFTSVRARATATVTGLAVVTATRGFATANASSPAFPGSFTAGDLLYANTASTVSGLADVAVGQVLASGGVGVAPAYTANPTVSSLTAPTVVGGTTAAGTLILKSTTGSGDGTGAIKIQGGNNGATLICTFNNDGSAACGGDLQAQTFTTTGRITSGSFIRAGAADATSPAAGDLVANRGGNPGTGVVFFGGSANAHYLFYDGTNFSFVGNPLVVTGLTANGNVITDAAIGVAGGYKIARGATAFDGSNPTTVATGLTSVVSCTATLRLTAALTTGTAFVTHAAPSSGNVDFYAWVIAGTASTGTETFDWVCVGT